MTKKFKAPVTVTENGVETSCLECDMVVSFNYEKMKLTSFGDKVPELTINSFVPCKKHEKLFNQKSPSVSISSAR